MKKATTAIVATLLCGVALLGWRVRTPAAAEGTDQPRDKAAASREAAAVRKTAEQFNEAFNRGDAKAVAAFWTKDGEYVGPDGEAVRGRQALEKAYADFLKKNPSAADYADQAVTFADRGRQARPAGDQEWQPLGVFGMVPGEEQAAQHIFQLAVNRDGIVRGNYYDAVADNTLPVYGSVGRQTQRVAWSIGPKKDIVYETGLQNLTRNETSILTRHGKDRTQQMISCAWKNPAKRPARAAPGPRPKPVRE